MLKESPMLKDSPMLKAILFDFNGVILDDEDYHYQSFKNVLQEENVSITRDAYYQDCLGFNDIELFRWGLKDSDKIQKAGGLEALVNRKSIYYEEFLNEETPFFPGVCPFIEKAAPKYLLGIASMALRREIEITLQKGRLSDLFSVIVSGEEVTQTKPHPEAYQEALRRLNMKLCKGNEQQISSAQCLVIEDSVAGIKAGKAAGMHVLALAQTTGAESLHEADKIIPSLENLSIEDLEGLFY